MSTADDDYMAFLNKANEPSGPSPSSSAQQQTTTTASSKANEAEVPRVLAAAGLEERYFTSEADEPFEPVSFKWSGGGGGTLDLSEFDFFFPPPHVGRAVV